MVEIYSNSKRICKKKKERKREKLRWLWSGARWGRGEEKKRREERYPVPSIDNSTLSILYPTFAFLLKLVRLQRWEGGRGKTFLPAIAHRLTGNTSHRRGAAIPFAYPRATSRTTRDPNVNGIMLHAIVYTFPVTRCTDSGVYVLLPPRLYTLRLDSLTLLFYNCSDWTFSIVAIDNSLKDNVDLRDIRAWMFEIHTDLPRGIPIIVVQALKSYFAFNEKAERDKFLAIKFRQLPSRLY